jgi:hypothetical protein
VTTSYQRRRFLYLHHTTTNTNTNMTSSFPMSLGTEIVAAILNIPEKSFWKNCILSEEEEKQLTEEFRESFAAFDPAAAV